MKSIIYRVLLSTLLGAFAMVFWMRIHPEWLSFQEQYQMFLFTGDYMALRLSVAGGVADYVAEFLVQFFYYTWSGALVMALLLVGLQLSVWLISYRLCGEKDNRHYAISLLPSLLMVSYMSDPGVMPTYLVTLIIALLCVWGYAAIEKHREYVQVALIPLVYWMTGYGVFVYAILSLVYDLVKGGVTKRNLIFAVVHIIVVALSVFVATRSYMVRYTMHDILYGVNNYRERFVTPSMQHWIAVSVVVIPILVLALSKLKYVVISAVEVLCALALGYWTTNQYSPMIWQQLKLDYMVRNQRWNAVLNTAKMGMPQTPMSCTAVNLALGMKGQLLDNMFAYYQCGQDGLISRFDRNMVACTITAEACYHVGLINAALRYNYDLQEAIDNRRKSCRFSQRVAEGYIVNHRYDVAEKYLKRLRATLFYSDWAKDATTYLYDDAKVDAHPVWGKLRKYQFADQELNSFSDMDMMLYRLYDHCKENKLALDYALACMLLNRDMDKFNEYYELRK
ncbi:MAG: DUF6057 family protein [Bacteroidales bacterium]|nr:DUF6057 family protein [Bacteroidales bacterium]